MGVLLLQLAAATETTPTDSFDVTAFLAQYGVLGVAAGMLVVFARASYKRETDRADRLETEVFRLHTAIQERHIPALEQAARALQETTIALRDLQARQDLERALKERRADGA